LCERDIAEPQRGRDVITRSFPDAAVAPVELPEPVEASAPAPAAPAEEDEHRRGRRHPLIWSGQIHYDYDSTPVRIRNISSTGALIECDRSLAIGAEPLLDLGEAGSHFATVMWAVGDQVGLAFKGPFDLAQLARAKPEVAPSRWVRPSYLDENGKSDSPWDEHWQRMSVNELSDELDGFLKR
jgi:hypothetical protein